MTLNTKKMKPTSLSNKHISLGAKMVPFAGFNMPVSYSGLNEEHLAVRSSVGVFDVSHMGEFILKGPHALELIQKVTSNDAAVLTDGKAQYSCLPNNEGGIVDDLIVYRIDAQTYLLVVNAGNIDKDWNWIKQHNTMGVDMKNISEETSLLAIQGPNAIHTLQKLTDVKLSEIPYYAFARGKFNGVDNVVISNTGYTGAGGFEIYFENQYAEKMWDAIFEAGKEFNIKPIGLGARDTLRLEMGFCLYGNDIDNSTSPIEAGLGWITKFTKDFTNRPAIEAQKLQGVSKKLVGFEMVERGIPRHDYPIADAQGTIIGKVTSGTQSPSLNKAIGLGYVTTAFSKTDTELFVIIRDKPVKARVCKLPFLKK